MATDNDRLLIVNFEDVKSIIRTEVAKFREELSGFLNQEETVKHLDTKPLSIQQVADRYGKSKATIHNWLKQGIIQGFKQGKGRYFYLHELDQSLKRYKYFDMLKITGEISKDKGYYEYQRERGN